MKLILLRVIKSYSIMKFESDNKYLRQFIKSFPDVSNFLKGVVKRHA
jgi:hypothetical protein